MTNDDALFRDKVLEFIDVKWENVAPDPPQSSLTALMYTAADFRMKWDKTNEHVKKIIVLITNEESVNKIDAPGLFGKPKPKGGGHDTCTDHSFADPHLVASQLTNGGFGVITLVGPSNRAEATDQFPSIDVWMIWDKYFSAMGIEYMVFPIPIQNNDTKANPEINKPVVDPIEEVVEVVETTTVTEEIYCHVEWFEEVTISAMDAMVVNSGTQTSAELVSASGQKRDCEGLTKLQIVFVQDRSPMFDIFVKELAMMAKSIATGLQEMFPEVEFGLTTFSDFHPALKDGSFASAPIDKKLSCYERVQSLSSNPATLVKTLEKFENIPMIDDGGDITQSSLTAVLYTAADKQMNWASKNETGIKKVIFLITNMDTVNEDEAPKLVNKPKPKGTGEETCFEHSYPDTDFVGEFLKNKGINVVALLPTNNPIDLDVVKLWVTHLNTMGVKYDIQALETNHVLLNGLRIR
ncbi:unnamed protein product [Orchesella dallaii]|uniref:VWFA domain-containing protein n=1 Tax=Orchesella dallaii TaxID=48710 RepID=A0ABP1RQH5_9HEXA